MEAVAAPYAFRFGLPPWYPLVEPAPRRQRVKPARPIRERDIGVPAAAVLLRKSEPTIRRLLKVLPAPSTTGGARHTVSEWPDETSVRRWYDRACRARRNPPPPPETKPDAGAKKKRTTKKPRPSVTPTGTVDWKGVREEQGLKKPTGD